MARLEELEKVYLPNREAWRAWLAEHHQSSPGIWLIYYKKASAKSRVPYDDAVEEALCFGWIDSTARKIDEDSYCQLFTPRKPKSTWSKLNKSRVKQLRKQNLMTPAGEACIAIAKENGSWTILDDVEALIIPQDLETALKSTKAAFQHYQNFSNSKKKALLWWVKSAKRQETRSKRIAQVVKDAAIGKATVG
jgi:uncharacterized protein YdeI (YjbR/CyaY-like superfamily)